MDATVVPVVRYFNLELGAFVNRDSLAGCQCATGSERD
jgi:hypothetical protein